MEGVSILHDELTGTHDPKAWPHLVAELGLDLIEIDGQLPITAQFAAGDVGDHFLMGWADHKLALVSILEPQQFGPVRGPAARFLPELGGLYRRHEHFKRSGAVHLLANDLLHLAHHPQAHRQPAVNAGGDPSDQSGTQHQLVA